MDTHLLLQSLQVHLSIGVEDGRRGTEDFNSWDLLSLQDTPGDQSPACWPRPAGPAPQGGSVQANHRETFQKAHMFVFVYLIWKILRFCCKHIQKDVN